MRVMCKHRYVKHLKSECDTTVLCTSHDPFMAICDPLYQSQKYG